MKNKRPKPNKLGSGKNRVVSTVSPSTSLPPLVEGQVRCFLRVTVSSVLWTIAKPPALTLVRLRWWGETTSGTVFYPRDKSLISQKDIKSTARFAVRCGPKQFTSYLTDMGCLVLDVLTKLDHLPIARVQIAGIARLSLSHPINGFFTLVSPTSEKLGELQVTLALEPLMETCDSSSSVPTIDISVEALPSPSGHVPVQNTLAPSIPLVCPVNTGKESLEGGSSSTPRGRDHLYFQDEGNLPIIMKSPARHEDSTGQQKHPSDGSHAGFATRDYKLDHETAEADLCTPPVENHASVDLLSVILERGSRLRNAMLGSALKTDAKDTSMPHLTDPSSLPSSKHLLPNILHSDLQHTSQDPDLLQLGLAGDSLDSHDDPALELLLGSSVLPVWDGDGSLANSLSVCSSVLLDSELGDPQYDQSLLENLFYKAPKFDDCSSGEESDSQKKANSSKRPDKDAGQTSRPQEELPGLTADRIALLGNIHLARVVILHLAVATDTGTSSGQKIWGKGRPPRPLCPKKCTYFVEYLFPLPSANNETGTAAPSEVTRVVSSKVVEGVVNFQQQGIFPVHLSVATIKWWCNTNLTFTVYCRKSHQKKPVPIGAATFPLQTILQSSQLEITAVLPVQGLDGDLSGQNVGSLKVLLELSTNKKDFSKSKSGKRERSPSRKDHFQERDGSVETHVNKSREEFPPTLKSDNRADSSPVEDCPAQNLLMVQDQTQSALPRQTIQISPVRKHSQHGGEEEEEILLHALLMVPHGKDFNCVPMQPNVYLNCKLFGSEETTRSGVSWGQTQPTFSLVQVAPVTLTSRLLERMRNNVMVIEVWLKATSQDNDKLLGLVKLPLHQFYMSFRDPKICQLLLQAQYPVLAADGYMPVVDIFTAATRGHLRVCLAMGSAQQIAAFQRMRYEELSSAHLPSRPVHQLDHRAAADRQESTGPHAEALNEHVFVVRVEKVKGLTPLQSTIWGEADCYIQYSFPSQGEEAGQDIDPNIVETSVDLKSYRTTTTLCVPDPVFGHCETHIFLAPPGVQVQRLLLSSLAGQSLGGGAGIQFEVWCRYYYPNVREQLVARGILPMAKLCAVVTMQKQGSTEAQFFSLPLVPWSDRPADFQPQPTGLLEVSVQYKTRPVRSGGGRSGAASSRVVNLLVQVHRAAGLQAAARALALRYYSKVGINAFVSVQLSLLSERESRSTRVVARSFCPEFQHHAEFCCQLLVQRDSGESVSLAELLHDATALFTVYHRNTRKVDASGSKDSVLGTIRIRLADLLHKRAGISGWYGLSLPSSVSPRCSLTPVGGLELSINFAHHSDRERVLSSARLLGWEAERDGEEEEEWNDEDGDASLEGNGMLMLTISMPRAWLPVHCLLLPGHKLLQRSTYCYYRYKLYDQETFCSELRHPVLEKKEEEEENADEEEERKDPGLATVAFPGGRVAELRKSLPLCWYLKEERLEVQLWVSFRKEKRVRPHDMDRLVGSAFVDLSSLAAASKHKTISGVYPLFKRSAADLGGAALRVHITASRGSATHVLPAPLLNEEEEEGEEEEDRDVIQDTPVKEEADRGPLSRQSCGPAGSSRISSRPLTKLSVSPELPPSHVSDVSSTFTATVSVERAMHLSLKGCPLAERSGGLPSCCVSYATADELGTVGTDVVQDSDCPVWDHHQECRLSKDLLVDPQQSLVFKVWHKGEVERVIGFASVDLSPLLSGFQSVCGWYNITDFSGQCQGQLKVSVSNLTGVQELRNRKQAIRENAAPNSASACGALPLCYQTSAVYNSFPSHISRFTEQRISTSPDNLDRLLSGRYSLTDRHEDHMDSVHQFHQTVQKSEDITMPSSSGDAHTSTSALYSALRKNLSELDDIKKYFSRKLSTSVFSHQGIEQDQVPRQVDWMLDSVELVLKSNQLVGAVNKMKGKSEHQAKAATSNPQRNPSSAAEKDAHGFSSANLRLAESESDETETSSQKHNQETPEYILPVAEKLRQEIGFNEDLEHEENEKDEDASEDAGEEFEETLIDILPLNEVTSLTDKTSPWTSVMSDPDLSSLESLEMVEQPASDRPRFTQDKEVDVDPSPPAPSWPSVSQPEKPTVDSDLSNNLESSEDESEDEGAAKDVQSDCEEHGNDHESLVDSEQDIKPEAAQDENDSTSSSEDESPTISRTKSHTKANSAESGTNLSDTMKIPNFFLPSYHLEASMRALRLAPVFPASSAEPETARSGIQFPRATRLRPNIPPSSANREETKRVAKIFASHFTKGS